MNWPTIRKQKMHNKIAKYIKIKLKKGITHLFLFLVPITSISQI